LFLFKYPDIDSQFQSFLDSAIKGSSELTGDDDDLDTSLITTPNNNVASAACGSQGRGRSRKSNKKRLSPLSLKATIESQTVLMYQEMKHSNLKQESDLDELVESSVLLRLMTSIKTKLEVGFRN
jgi:hypothetical protein